MKGKAVIGSLLCSIFLFPFTHAYSLDDERKGFIIKAGIGGGYTSSSSGEAAFENYSRNGLGVHMGLGYAPSNKSSIIFSIKSNVSVDEVASVWDFCTTRT